MSATLTSATGGNSFAGLAVGAIASSAMVMCGRATGCAFNPALGMLGFWLGNDSSDSGPTGAMLDVFWTGPLLGVAIAVLAFNLTRADSPTVNKM